MLVVAGRLLPIHAPVLFDPKDMPIALASAMLRQLVRAWPLARRNDESGAWISGQNGDKNCTPVISRLPRSRTVTSCDVNRADGTAPGLLSPSLLLVKAGYMPPPIAAAFNFRQASSFIVVPTVTQSRLNSATFTLSLSGRSRTRM
jgi:hypothetical protein